MLLYSALVVVVLWLSVLSFFLYQMLARYNNLVSKTSKKHLNEILDVMLKNQTVYLKEIEVINKQILAFSDQSKHFYQKIGFLRFNPFDNVGGEQSFVVALLDKENNGILLNFLYTREGVRTYAKKVRGGKNDEYDLSAEEKEVIKKAV